LDVFPVFNIDLDHIVKIPKTKTEKRQMIEEYWIITLNDEYSAPHLNVTCFRHGHDIVRNKCSSGDEQQLLNYLTDMTIHSNFVDENVMRSVALYRKQIGQD